MIFKIQFKNSKSNDLYEIECDDNDTVLSLKKKLSDKISMHTDCITLIYNNKICCDSDSIIDYKIGSNEFILFDIDDGEINRSCDKARVTKRIDDDCEKFISVIVENYTDKGDDFLYVTVHPDDKIECLRDCGDDSVEFFYRESILSIDKSFRYYGIIDGDRVVMARDRNKIDERWVSLRIEDADGSVFQLNVNRMDTVDKLIKDINYRLVINNDSVIILSLGGKRLEGHKVLKDYGLTNGDSLQLIRAEITPCGHKYPPVSLIPLNVKHEPIECRIGDASLIDTAIDAILMALNIDEQFKSSIKLFTNPDKIYRIKNDSDITESLWNPRYEPSYQIYYSIKLLDDHLIRNKMIGEGAFGTVYLCTDIDLNTQKALKEFTFLSHNKTEWFAFNREIEVYEKLGDHPRIVKYERHFETETALFILMEYMPGGSLGSYLRTNGALSEDRISKYAKQICEGLKYLHDNRIIHRDVKGEKVLIDSNDNIKLCDFGLSRILMNLAGRYFISNAVDSIEGTTNWMAPEIIKGEKYGSAIDIWSFGATMVEMVTGHPPFYGMNSFQVIYNIAMKETIDFSYPPHSSDNIKSFIDCCLQGNPLQRSTVNELLNHAFVL